MTRVSFYNSDVATEHYLGLRWPRAIWQAVLEQAIKDIVEGPSVYETKEMNLHERAEFRLAIQVAAQHWVDDEANEPRRFVWVCEQLGLQPSAVRETIKRRTA